MRQQHADLLPALQFAHFASVQRVFNSQSVEQHCGVRFRGVTALFANDAFELTKAHAIGVRQLLVRLGVQRIALFERLPERAIAHDDGIDDSVLVKSKLVLAQDAHLLRARDRATGGVKLPSQDFHECGFSGAVRTGDRVAAASHEGAGHILKEDPRAEPHGDVVDG